MLKVLAAATESFSFPRPGVLLLERLSGTLWWILAQDLLPFASRT